MAHSEQSTWPATRHVDQPTFFRRMIRPLLNSFNFEKCLLTRLLGILSFLKSSYNQHAFVTFINLPLNTGLHDVPHCSAAAWWTVMRIVTILGSLTYHVFFLLLAKFHDCIFFPSWGAVFNVLECIYSIYINMKFNMIIKELLRLKPTRSASCIIGCLVFPCSE